MSKSPETVKQLVPNEQNPRSITTEALDRLKKSYAVYGDLSGVVFNRRTRKQVGGHQRCKILEEDAKIECKYFDHKDEKGTVGSGFVVSKEFGRIPYREVDWPKEIEYAAMIAANQNAGEWDESLLRQTLTLISEHDTIETETLGLNDDFLENLFRGKELELNVQEQEAKALIDPLTITELKNLPSQTAMVQIFFTLQTRPLFLETVRKLQVAYGTKNITETISKAVDFAYANRENQA